MENYSIKNPRVENRGNTLNANFQPRRKGPTQPFLEPISSTFNTEYCFEKLPPSFSGKFNFI